MESGDALSRPSVGKITSPGGECYFSSVAPSGGRRDEPVDTLAFVVDRIERSFDTLLCEPVGLAAKKIVSSVSDPESSERLGARLRSLANSILWTNELTNDRRK